MGDQWRSSLERNRDHGESLKSGLVSLVLQAFQADNIIKLAFPEEEILWLGGVECPSLENG